MTLHELKAYQLALRDKLRQLDSISATCDQCENFQGGRCEKFAAVPPKEFQHQPGACQEWQYDFIPF